MKVLQNAVVLLLAGSFPVALAAPNPTLLNDNILTCQPSAGCTRVKMFGRDYSVLQTDRFVVMVAISTEGRYTRADVSIANNTGMPLNVSPDDFRVEVLTPKPRILPYIAPAELKDVPIVSPPPAPALSTRPHRTLFGILPNGAANSSQTQILQQVEIASDPPNSADREAALNHLEAKSIPPSQVARGRVYFQRDSHSHLIQVVLPVAGMVFEFPFAAKP